MTEREIKDACSLLDAQYDNCLTHESATQIAYYEGMKTIIEDILLGTEDILIRYENGKHDIINKYVPF